MEMCKRSFYQSELSSNSHNPRKTWKLIHFLTRQRKRFNVPR